MGYLFPAFIIFTFLGHLYPASVMLYIRWGYLYLMLVKFTCSGYSYPSCIMLYSWGYLYHFIYHGVALSVGQAILKLGPVPFVWSALLCE